MRCVKKIFFIVFISIVFTGCVSNVAYTTLSITKDIYTMNANKGNYKNKDRKRGIQTINTNGLLTLDENKFTQTLPKEYFENSSWKGFIKMEGVEESHLAHFKFKKLLKKSNFSQFLDIKIFDHRNKNKLIALCNNISMTRNKVGTFIIPMNLKNCKKYEMLDGIMAFNRRTLSANMFSGTRFFSQVPGKLEEEGYFYMQRVDNYKLPKKEFDKKLLLDLNQKNDLYKIENDSRVILSISGNENNNSPFGKVTKLNNNKVISMANNYINIWDIKKNSIVKKISLQQNDKNIGKIIDFELSPDKKNIAIIGTFDGPKLSDIHMIHVFNIKKEKIVKSFTPIGTYPKKLQFSKDGKYLISSYEIGKIGIWDFRESKFIKSIDIHEGEKGFKNPLLKIQKTKNDYHIYVSYKNNLKKYSLKSKKLLKEYRHRYPIRTIAKSSKYLVVASQAQVNGKIRNEINILDNNLKIIKPINFKSMNPASNIFFNQKENILVITSLNTIMSFDVRKKFKEKNYYNKNMLSELKISASTMFDNRNILYQDSITKFMYLFNINTKKIKKLIGNDNLSIFALGLKEKNIGFSSLNMKKDVDKNFIYNFDKLLSKSFNIENKKFGNIEGKYSRGKKTHSSYFVKKVLSSVYQSQVLELYKNGFFGTSKVSELKKDFDEGEEHLSHIFYKDYVISSGVSELTVYDFSGNKVSKLVGQNGHISGLAIHKDKLLSSSFNGTISLWDLSKINNTKLKPTISLLLTKDEEWVMWTPEGYFDSSENGYKYIGFHINQGYKKEGKWIGIEKLYDHFYRPDLVKLALNGKDITHYTKGLSYVDVLKNPAPKIKITKANNKRVRSTKIKHYKNKINLEFDVKSVDKGGVGTIRIYQEGKLVKTIGEDKINRASANVVEDLKTEELAKKAKENQEEYLAKLENSVTKSMNGTINDNELVEEVEIAEASDNEGVHKIALPLKAGKNKIEIEAFNKTNTVSSIRKKFIVNAKIKKRKPIVYAIIAGVNEFQDTKRFKNLKYSENDAKAIKNMLKLKIREKVVSTLLLGKDFTKENLDKAIKKIKSKARLEDKIVFYVSTHGKASRGNLYIVPQNNKFVRDFIKFEDMFKQIQSISALDQVFIIDACESGKAKDIVSSIYDSKASVLAKQSGVHVLLATTKGTFAFEHPNPKIKHGVFTNNILTALKTRKTDKNKDRKISVIELSKVLKSPEYVTEHQYPVIRNVGQDTKIRDF